MTLLKINTNNVCTVDGVSFPLLRVNQITFKYWLFEKETLRFVFGARAFRTWNPSADRGRPETSGVRRILCTGASTSAKIENHRTYGS